MVKRKRVERFLRDGDKVKITMRFRGREVTHPEIGREILKRLAESVEEFGTIETAPRLEGRQITMVLAGIRQQKPARRSNRHEDTADGIGDEQAEETSLVMNSDDATPTAEVEDHPTSGDDTESKSGDAPVPEQAATDEENESAEAENT